jgi:hypothetical protein
MGIPIDNGNAVMNSAALDKFGISGGIAILYLYTEILKVQKVKG